MKKFLPYILILVVLAGILGSVKEVRASQTNRTEACVDDGTGQAKNAPCQWQFCWDSTGTLYRSGISEANCKSDPTHFWGTKSEAAAKFGSTNGLQPGGGVAAGDTKPQSAFEQAIKDSACDVLNINAGCVAHFVYWVVYTPATFLLYVAALFLNAMLALTMNGGFLRSPFLSAAWSVVRDLSNIFFILILLWVAFQMIIGMAGHDTKKTIGQVIIMALLINFSMFFTNVVIDSTNILALVFYNKLQPTTQNGSDPLVNDGMAGAKDITGTMYGFFDPTKVLTPDFFNKPITIVVPGNNGQLEAKQTDTVGKSPSILIGITLFAAIFMWLAAYCFVVAGVAFVVRLVELFAIIVFSPFAFMSSTVHKLSSIEFIGWDKWLSKLLSVAFMAPIFMFFLYFIFLLLRANPFINAIPGDGLIQNILRVAIPGLVVLILLLKATSFAKKGAGKLGEMASGFAKAVGGLALGAASGGTAALGVATLGRAGAAAANSDWAKKWEAHGVGGHVFRRAATGVGTSSFDIRAVKVGGKSLANTTGMDVGQAKKGGFIERRKEQVSERVERAKSLEIGEDSAMKQALNRHKADLETLKLEGAHEIGEIDKRLEGAIKADNAAQSAMRANPENLEMKQNAQSTAKRVNDLRKQRSTIKNASGTDKNIDMLMEEVKRRERAVEDAKALGDHAYEVETEGDLESLRAALRVAKKAQALGNRSMNDYEDALIPEAEHAIHHENQRRKLVYAASTEGALGQFKDFVLSGGQHSFAGAREAANKIRTNASVEKIKRGKIDVGGGSHSEAHAAPAHGAEDHGGGDHGGGGHGSGDHGGGDHGGGGHSGH